MNILDPNRRASKYTEVVHAANDTTETEESAPDFDNIASRESKKRA